MFSLFEIAYKFRVKGSTENWYEICQVVAKELAEAKVTITNNRGSIESFLEFKLLTVTPITGSFVTYLTILSETTYHQFECIEKE